MKYYFKKMNNYGIRGIAHDWFVSSNKTKYILLRPKQMRENLSGYSIQIGNNKHDRVGNDCKEKSTKLLGMNIDENLT